MRYLIFSLFIFLITACASDYGHRVSGENLTVYFDNEDDARLAEDVARYWKDYNLITGQKQDLRLVRKKETYQLKLIAINPKEVKNMPALERYQLTELQKDLRDKVFGEKIVQIVLCNDKFESLYNINS